jgi:hypothetical protein
MKQQDEISGDEFLLGVGAGMVAVWVYRNLGSIAQVIEATLEQRDSVAWKRVHDIDAFDNYVVEEMRRLRGKGFIEWTNFWIALDPTEAEQFRIMGKMPPRKASMRKKCAVCGYGYCRCNLVLASKPERLALSASPQPTKIIDVQAREVVKELPRSQPSIEQPTKKGRGGRALAVINKRTKKVLAIYISLRERGYLDEPAREETLKALKTKQHQWKVKRRALNRAIKSWLSDGNLTDEKKRKFRNELLAR